MDQFSHDGGYCAAHNKVTWDRKNFSVIIVLSQQALSLNDSLFEPSLVSNKGYTQSSCSLALGAGAGSGLAGCSYPSGSLNDIGLPAMYIL